MQLKAIPWWQLSKSGSCANCLLSSALLFMHVLNAVETHVGDEGLLKICILVCMHKLGMLDVYSLGTMRLCKVSKDTGTVLEILDGQQRLVTLCLILAAIRKKLLDHGDNTVIDTAKEYAS